MKTLLHALVALSLVFSLQVSAAILPGQVTGYGVLGCMMHNFTGQPQIIDQVQYYYTCNHGPHDPFHTYYQVLPCYGNCEVDHGRSYWHTNGPFTYNCLLLNSSCQGYSHAAPTPRPSPSPAGTPEF